MAFVSRWSVVNGDTIILPIAVGTSLVNVMVDWGDGTTDTYTRTIFK